MVSPVKTQVENGISKLFDFRGQTIDVSDQAIFILKDPGLHDDEGNKTNVRYPLKEGHRRSGRFLSFMTKVHLDQADPKCNYSCMTCRDCVQLPLDVDGIDTSIDNQMLKPPHDLLVHLAALENGIKPDIGTLKKDIGDIFSECCTEIFKSKFIRYVNEVLFEMVKTALKYTYLGTKTPTSLKNEVSTCRQIYYDIDTHIMVNQSVNEFYTRFLSKIDAFPQEVAFPLDIAATFFKNLSPDVREFLISDGVQVPPRPPTENNHQGN